jgi:4,5-dihydroxyphthalate decarboxylase
MALTCTLISSGLTEPILTGTVAPDGLDAAFSSANVDDNSRGMIAGKYDIAEMSIGTFVQARARGADFVAVPVFLGRRFMQPCIFFAADAPIHEPRDLRGKKIAFPQFWMTSSVWHRGVLVHEYGVPVGEVEFLTTQRERMEAPFTPGVRVTQIMDRPLPEFFGMIPTLLADGTVDVIFAPKAPDDTSGLRGLFADPIAATLDYRKRTGIYPLMHTIVLKGSVVREQPGITSALLDLFTRAKAHAYAHPGKIPIESPLSGRTFEESRALLGGDPYPFGLGPNSAAIEAFLDYAAEQTLSSKRVAIGEAFVE